MKAIFDSNSLITACKFSLRANPLIGLISQAREITIPKSVSNETIKAKRRYPDARVAAEYIGTGAIKVAEAEVPKETFLHDYNLGRGEKEAIYLYLKRRKEFDYIVTDDKLVYIICDRMGLPKLFFPDLVIALVKESKIKCELAQEIIELTKPRYSKGMISHSLALLKEVGQDA